MTIVWVDDVTPLDAAHMNELEQVTRKGVPDGYASLGADGLVPPTQLPAIPPLVITDADIPASITRDTELAAGLATKADTAAMAAADILKVDKDSVVTAAVRLVASKLLAGDAQPAFRIFGDGKIEWGAGGAALPNASLFRDAAGLRTNAGLRVDGAVAVGYGLPGQVDISADQITFHGGDTTLLRAGVGSLRTTGQFFVDTNLIVDASSSGTGKLAFGLAGDTSLYRQSAAVLRTDGRLDANALSINGVPLSTAVVDITGKVDKDSVVVAATRLLATKLLAGDAQPTFRILGDGKMQWGSGGAAAPDVSLYYYGGGLRSDRSIFADQGFTARQGGPAQVDVGSSSSTPMVLFGGDTTLYRVAAAVLQTDGGLNVGTRLRVSTAANLTDPSGGIYFGAANDTNLYREAAGVLRTDSHLVSAGQVHSNRNTAQAVILSVVGAAPGILFSNAIDTNLYRAAAGQLKTDGLFLVGGGQVYLRSGSATNGIWFGASDDTNLYRQSAGMLKTDGSFRAGGGVYANAQGTNQISLDTDGKLYFNIAFDTNLYRSAAGVLKTDGQFQAASVLTGHFGVGPVVPGNDCDLAVNNGWYFAQPSTAHSPGGSYYGILAINVTATSQVRQYAYDYNGDLTYFRRLTAPGPFGPWIQIWGPNSYTGTGLMWGGDTTLSRSAANVLGTPGALSVGADLSLTTVGAGAANQTALVANIGGLGLRRFEVGAADSGGAGFRALRVSN